MSPTEIIRKERSCASDSVALTLSRSEHPTWAPSQFNKMPLPAVLNHRLGSIDPPLARYLFPSPVAPPQPTLAGPEVAGLSPCPLVLPKLLDSHAIPGDEFEAFDLTAPDESYSPPAPLEQSLGSELTSYTESVKPEPIPLLEPRMAMWARPAAPARVAIMVFGILLVSPSSTTIQRSVAAKDHSIPEQFSSAAPSLLKATLPDTAPATPPPSPEPAFRDGKSHVFLTASDRSWVVACADGKVLFARLFTAGNTDTIEFNRRAIVRVGSAGSVQIVADGKSPGTLGSAGQVRILEFTPGNSQFLKGGEIEDCTIGR